MRHRGTGTWINSTEKQHFNVLTKQHFYLLTFNKWFDNVYVKIELVDKIKDAKEIVAVTKIKKLN